MLHKYKKSHVAAITYMHYSLYIEYHERVWHFLCANKRGNKKKKKNTNRGYKRDFKITVASHTHNTKCFTFVLARAKFPFTTPILFFFFFLLLLLVLFVCVRTIYTQASAYTRYSCIPLCIICYRT